MTPIRTWSKSNTSNAIHSSNSADTMQFLSDPSFDRRISFRDLLIASFPGCLIVVICLSFFLSKAFTIDDTIFLRTAEQATETPSHPFAFDMCWEADGQVRRFSQFVANAPLMGYVLIPAVLSKRPEVTGHLLQLLLLTSAILATASLALRFGLSRRDASFAATLTATCPVVIAMAATVMPDILAMTLAVIAVERFVAWRQNPGWLSAIAACAALAIAPLSRAHLILLFPACLLLGVSYVSLDRLRKDWRQLMPVVALVAASVVVYYSIVLYTRDPAAHAVVFRKGLIGFSPLVLLTHSLSLGCYFSMTTPFIAGLVILLVRYPAWRVAAIVCALPFCMLVISRRSGWYVLGSSSLAYLALAWTFLQLLKLRTGPAYALALWMVLPFPVIAYIQMAAKYIVPAVPAYSLVLVLLAGSLGVRRNWIWQVLPAAGLIVAVLIVSADNRAANMARFAVEKWANPAELNGRRLLFLGQWGFQWYAELHQAACFDSQSSTSARPGDRVMVDQIGGRPFPKNLYPNSHIIDVVGDTAPGGVLLDREKNVGFYSDLFGRLPWSWAPAGTLRFELWEIH